MKYSNPKFMLLAGTMIALFAEAAETAVLQKLPGSPNAWSGVVEIVPAGQIQYIDKPMMSVIEHAEQLGRGSHDMLNG